MRILIAFALANGALVLGGCQRSSDALPGASEDGARVQNVVARVAGTSIGAAEVEALMLAEGLSGDEAVQRLVDESLLAHEGERLGLTLTEEGERAVERRMVRSMLRDMEADATPEDVTEEELQEDYERYRDRYRIPELRKSWHIVVKDTGPEGKALATSILRGLHRASAPREVFERYESRETEEGEIEILAEDLPQVPKNAGLEKPYLDALFGAKSVGPLNNLVETSYGWHAIVVTEIQPANVKTRADVEEETRERISQAKRLAGIVRVVRALHAENLVSYDDEGVDRLLAMEGLPEPVD